MTGTALWIYADFVTGHKSVLEWHSFAPWWIADFLPNVESESEWSWYLRAWSLLYWPARKADLNHFAAHLIFPPSYLLSAYDD